VAAAQWAWKASAGRRNKWRKAKINQAKRNNMAGEHGIYQPMAAKWRRVAAQHMKAW